jgi:hypothetical protein
LKTNIQDNLYESFIVYSNEEDEDDDNYSNISEEFERRVKDINLNLTRSLNRQDGDDTISLYAYVDDEWYVIYITMFWMKYNRNHFDWSFLFCSTIKKKVSWEEWYLRKKIEAFKNEKLMKSQMQKRWEEDKKLHNRKNMSEEEKNKFLMDWWDKKKQQKEKYEEKLRKLQEENERKVRNNQIKDTFFVW